MSIFDEKVVPGLSFVLSTSPALEGVGGGGTDDGEEELGEVEKRQRWKGRRGGRPPIEMGNYLSLVFPNWVTFEAYGT